MFAVTIWTYIARVLRGYVLSWYVFASPFVTLASLPRGMYCDDE